MQEPWAVKELDSEPPDEWRVSERASFSLAQLSNAPPKPEAAFESCASANLYVFAVDNKLE